MIETIRKTKGKAKERPAHTELARTKES